jgi:hypothetical protein
MRSPRCPITGAIVAVLCAPLLLVVTAVLAQSESGAGGTTGRVIVMFKPDAKVLAAHDLPSALGSASARAAVLSKRTGIALSTGAEVGERMQVV